MLNVEQLDAVLPQTQCEQCGYKGCKAYAQAILDGQAEINRCPPGGERGIQRLATLTGRKLLPLDTSRGEQVPFEIAYIDPQRCIGCRLCRAVCPTDAIVGGPKKLHTVLKDWCTGCVLCAMACPMDCIEMKRTGGEWTTEMAEIARVRYEEKQRRYVKMQTRSEQALEQKSADTQKKKALLASLVKRVRSRDTQ